MKKWIPIAFGLAACSVAFAQAPRNTTVEIGIVKPRTGGSIVFEVRRAGKDHFAMMFVSDRHAIRTIGTFMDRKQLEDLRALIDASIVELEKPMASTPDAGQSPTPTVQQ